MFQHMQRKNWKSSNIPQNWK